MNDDTRIIDLTVAEFRSLLAEVKVPPAPPLEVLTSAQAAEIAGRSAKSMERLARAGECPAFRFGRQWRFKRSLVLEWLTKGAA